MTQAQSPSELDRWRNAAMDLQPMSALGQLTQMVTHDLNNQLQSMVLHLEMLKPLGEHDEKVRKHINRIAEAVERAEAFVVYLRDVRVNSEKGSETKLKRVIEGIVSLLDGTFKRANLTCEISCDDKIPLVNMPMLSVHEVLLNIIMNAIEASEEGGSITIKAMQQDGNVVVEVCDSGTGMSDKDFARVVEPFFTTKGDDHQGLGMTVADAVLAEYGGLLTYSRLKSGGAIAKVTLPRTSHP